MNTIKFDNKGTIKMIAHRGVSGLERENTCPAFVAAGVKSYYGIETDVHITKDGRYIIHHDDTVQRLTGLDRVIKESNFEYLRTLRMTDLDGVTERADLFLPSLDEYLSICKKYGKVAVLELKEEMSEENVCGIVRAVDAMGMLENTTFISFSKQDLIFLKKNFPTASAQFLTGDTSDETIQFMVDYDLDADMYSPSVTKEFIDKIHAAGHIVNAWTINDIAEAERLAEIGIDMITTNILE